MPRPNDKPSRLNDTTGEQVYEIQPVIVGGNHAGPGEQITSNPSPDDEAVRYGNKIIQVLRKRLLPPYSYPGGRKNQ